MGMHNLDFVRGVAMVLRGEIMKASAFVDHGLSLGVLREKMVRKFVHEETPERFRVETGFIRGKSAVSRQCDILVHQAAIHAPLYRLDDFVVVRPDSARAVIEVKSTLDQERFDEIIAVHTSIVSIRPSIPTFGFGIKGVTFETFVDYAAKLVQTNPLNTKPPQFHMNWPLCIAVQDRHYIGFRHLGGSLRYPMCFCAVDFAQSIGVEVADFDGIETGYFLQFYESLLQNTEIMQSDSLLDWFNRLCIEDSGKVWITTDGVVHFGPVPKNDPAPPKAIQQDD